MLYNFFKYDLLFLDQTNGRSTLITKKKKQKITVKAWRIPQSQLSDKDNKECCRVEHFECLQAICCNRLELKKATDGNGFIFFTTNPGFEAGLVEFITYWAPKIKHFELEVIA